MHEAKDQDRDTASADGDEILCWRCGTLNSTYVGRCIKCNSPLPCADKSCVISDETRNTGAAELIRRVRGSGLAMCAMWVIGLPVAVFVTVVCLPVFRGSHQAGIGRIIGLCLVSLYAVGLYRVTRRHFSVRRRQTKRCQKCGCEFRGLAPSYCPECGSPLDHTGDSVSRQDDTNLLEHVSSTEQERSITVRRSSMQFAIIGVWLVFGPVLLGLLVMTASLIVHADRGTEVAMLWLAVWVYLAILFMAVVAYLRSWEYGSGLCQQCGYNLLGLSSPRCPECGATFDPEELDSEAAFSNQFSSRRTADDRRLGLSAGGLRNRGTDQESS